MNDTVRKSILITGCSSGIGLCAAQQLQARGYRVFASARKPKDVTRLRELGLTESLMLDLDDSTSIRTSVEQVLDKTDGKLYALFNNGAYGQPGAVEDLTRDTLRKQFETNLFGTHELTTQVLPAMRLQGEGRIIQNSSILGFAAMGYRGAYNASKYALEGLTDTLRLELRETNIHISLIEPGPIVSRFRDNAYANWEANINPTHSFHRDAYKSMLAHFTKKGPTSSFTLPPEAVVKRLVHALESKRPRARYPVTAPTYVFGVLKRLLPTHALDWLLAKV